MVNFNILKELRTKEELVNYLKKNRQCKIETKIEAFKKNYEPTENNNKALSLKQLNAVIGGIVYLYKDAITSKYIACTSNGLSDKMPPQKTITKLSFENVLVLNEQGEAEFKKIDSFTIDECKDVLDSALKIRPEYNPVNLSDCLEKVELFKFIFRLPKSEQEEYFGLIYNSLQNK